jgi:hypothetical protein
MKAANARTFRLCGGRVTADIFARASTVQRPLLALVKQLSPEQKRLVLMTLAEQGRAQREARVDYAEAQLQRLCAERGLDWDNMSEDEREAFIDDLIQGDRL